jgi:hypothetical protein
MSDREEAFQRVQSLAATLPVVMRRLRADAVNDPAGLLKDLDAMSDAYRAALQAGMKAAYGELVGVGERPYGVGENGG